MVVSGFAWSISFVWRGNHLFSAEMLPFPNILLVIRRKQSEVRPNKAEVSSNFLDFH